MNKQRDIDLVNDLLSSETELTWVEFKNSNSNPKTIGTLVSAISNSARLAGRDFGYVLWGSLTATLNLYKSVYNCPNG